MVMGVETVDHLQTLSNARNAVFVRPVIATFCQPGEQPTLSWSHYIINLHSYHQPTLRLPLTSQQQVSDHTANLAALRDAFKS